MFLAIALFLSSCGDKIESSGTNQVTIWGIVCARKWFTILFMTIILVISNLIASMGAWKTFSDRVEKVHNLYDKLGDIVGSIGTGEYYQNTYTDWNYKPAMFGGAIFFSAIISLWFWDVVQFPFLTMDWATDISGFSFEVLLGVVIMFFLIFYLPSLPLGLILWGLPYLGNIVRYIMTASVAVYLIALLFTSADYKVDRLPQVQGKTQTEKLATDINELEAGSGENSITKANNPMIFNRIWLWTKGTASNISSFAKREFNNVKVFIDEKKEQRTQRKANIKNSESECEKDNDVGPMEKALLWFKQLFKKREK